MYRKRLITKQSVLVSFLLIAMVCTGGLTAVYAQDAKAKENDQEQPVVSEHVEVVNAEIVVRAMKKNRLIGGLKQSDFILLEDGNPLPITSFTEVRRKIGFNQGKDGQGQEEINFEEPTKKRLFFLYFRVYEPDPKIFEALDYFFNHIYKKTDYVIMMIKSRVFSVTKAEQTKELLAKIKKVIEEESRLETLERDRFASDMEAFIREFHRQFKENERDIFTETREEKQENLLRRSILEIKSRWLQYKNRHITVAINKLKLLASSFKPMSMEKWGLVFYQHDYFPMVDSQSLSTDRDTSYRYIDQFVREIKDLVNEAKSSERNIFVDDVKQAFIDANATFHLFLSSPRSMGKSESIYVTRSEIHSDWQLAFKGIAEATGGRISDSRELGQVMQDAVEKEDIFYRLTYAPRASGKIARKITLKTRLKKVDLEYHKTLMLEEAGVIRIENANFTYPALSFSLKNYRQFFDGNNLFGDIGLKVSTVDTNGDTLTFEKELHPDKEELELSMKVKFAMSGKHDLILEARDRQTGRTAVFKQKIDVPQSGVSLSPLSYDPILLTDTHEVEKSVGEAGKLSDILRKSAAYCKKLKKVTFYFICTEEVLDTYWFNGEKVKDDKYLYDYQILMQGNGQMKEARKIMPDKSEKVSKKKKRKKKKNDNKMKTPITNFYANYPFVMPISMLARENQSRYNYLLLGTDTVNGRKAIKVSVEPLEKENYKESGVYGLVWLSPADGSVLKIDVSPFSFSGVKGLKKMAKRKGTDLKISDIHWYDVERKGVRFPSKTAISCIFIPRKAATAKAAPQTDLEHMKTTFLYKNYQFFNVNVETRHGEN